MDFFWIIGTVASIWSIPLSIYLYIKSKENNIDKVKREIVKILSHQIGDRRKLTTFEIQTVINSKTRESKIDNEKITINQIIEDLVAETISNPLLEKTIKESIINELRNIYFKGELLSTIDRIEIETRDNNYTKKIEDSIEIEIKKIIETRRDIIDQLENQQKKLKRTSEYFAIIWVITTLLASTTISYMDTNKYNNFWKPFHNILQYNDFYIGIISSIIATITALVVLIIITRINKNHH